MHHTQAIEIAKLGVNIIIGTESKIHYTHAKEIVSIAVSKGSKVTIKKDYHHTHITEMAQVGGINLTIEI